MWGAQVELDQLSSYIRSFGATASRVATDMQVDNALGATHWQSFSGEVDARFVLTNDAEGTTRFIIETKNGTDGDRAELRVDTADALDGDVRDSGGTLVQSATGADVDWTVERTVRLRWDSQTALTIHSENMDIFTDAVRSAGSAATWTPGQNATTLYIGQDSSNLNQLNGLLATLNTYENPQAD